MLKGISPLLSPELLKTLAEMGHGDEIVLADANFPAASVGKRVVRLDGVPVADLLDAVLQLFPLDTYVEYPAALMEVVPGDSVGTPPIWDRFRAVISRYEPESKIEQIERFKFYERSREAYAVVQTGALELYANIILKKGVVKQA